MTEKEKRFAIIAGVIVLIILLLFWVKKNKGRTIINQYDESGLGDFGLSPFGFNLGDLILPDLAFYTGVSSCGCNGTDGQERPSMPIAPMMQKPPADITPIQSQNYVPFQAPTGWIAPKTRWRP